MTSFNDGVPGYFYWRHSPITWPWLTHRRLSATKSIKLKRRLPRFGLQVLYLRRWLGTTSPTKAELAMSWSQYTSSSTSPSRMTSAIPSTSYRTAPHICLGYSATPCSKNKRATGRKAEADSIRPSSYLQLRYSDPEKRRWSEHPL